MADDYTQFTYNVERNNPRNLTGLPFFLNFMLKYMLNGVSSVKGEEVKLRKAIEEHENNWIMTDHTDRLMNRDDPLILRGGMNSTRVEMESMSHIHSRTFCFSP
eukprot:TRINITY_DN16934_c0_g1_i1.p1 TRINITY_DN16934_c0_g1~~TRINITY_DN16934_c0_g1_i1.p1  ORF type:complete len:104 (+),score=25.61 TRINITY_DN16934_c0_g1_i1:178-489(+)